MSEKRAKGDNRRAKKYAVSHAADVARNQMLYLYNLKLPYRIIAALSVIFRWGAVKVKPSKEKGRKNTEGSKCE